MFGCITVTQVKENSKTISQQNPISLSTNGTQFPVEVQRSQQTHSKLDFPHNAGGSEICYL
jgi:hypothetical protein